MKFFLDENFPKTAEIYLKNLGYEVMDIRSTGQEGLDDHVIFKLAQFHSAIFLTTDRDFFHTIPFDFAEHHGAIIIALRQPNRTNITEKLKWLLNHLEVTDFRNTVMLLRDNNYTIRR